MTSIRKYKKVFIKNHPYFDIIPKQVGEIKWSKLENTSPKFRHVNWAKVSNEMWNKKVNHRRRLF